MSINEDAITALEAAIRLDLTELTGVWSVGLRTGGGDVIASVASSIARTRDAPRRGPGLTHREMNNGNGRHPNDDGHSCDRACLSGVVLVVRS